MSVLYAQVIVDIVHENVAHTFTYRIPDGMTLTAGQRVEVPFGRMRKEGVVLSLTQETDVPPEKLRDILRPLEDYAAICPTLLTLAQQMADDVHCPLAETLRLMLPAQMRGGRIQVKTQTVAQAAKPREMLEAAAQAEKRSPKRRLLLTVLSDERTHPVEELKLLVREPLQALRQIEAVPRARASSMAGWISSISSLPNNPFSPQCGFSPATPILGFLIPSARQPLSAILITSSTRSFFTRSQASLKETWVDTCTTRRFSWASIMV